MTESTCFKSKCLSCVRNDGCGWCNGPNAVAVGDCMPETDAAERCSAALMTETDECPSVGADVIIKNISGMVGAMVAIGILLNICNRLSNRRKSRKLQKSMLTLPVYIYSASTRGRAKAAREARASSQAVADAPHDIEHAGLDPSSSSSALPSSSASSTVAAAGAASPGWCSSAEDGDNATVVTCTICLAPYEEEEVIKVLPCGHDFHSGCLDSWLELKAVCPLCKEPAFENSRDRNQTSERHAHTHEADLTAAAPPFLRSTSNSPGRLQGSPRGRGVRPRGEVRGAHLLATLASPPFTPTPLEPDAAVAGVSTSVREDVTQERGAGATDGGRTRLSAEVVGGEEVAVRTRADESSQAEAETECDVADGITTTEARAEAERALFASAVVGTTPHVGATAGGFALDDVQERSPFPSTSSSPCHPRDGRATSKGAAWPREAPGDAHGESALDQLETGQAEPAEARAGTAIDPAREFDAGAAASAQ